MTALNCQSPLSGPNTTTTQVLSRTQPQKACYQVRSPDAENDSISHQLWPSMPLIKRKQRGNKTIITADILFSIFRKVDKNKKKIDFITITNANNSRSKTEKPKKKKRRDYLHLSAAFHFSLQVHGRNHLPPKTPGFITFYRQN